MGNVAGELEDQLLEVPLDDHVLDGDHGDFQEGGISGVGKVPVDFSSGRAIQSHELLHEVRAGLLPAGAIPREIGEAKPGDRAIGDLLFKEIDLV